MDRPVRRGDIWMIDLGMAAKIRPCMILSVAFRDNERAVVTYVARTTTLRGSRFEVTHQAPLFKPGAFDGQHIGTVPSVKLIRHLGRVSDTTLGEVEAAVRAWLGLEN